MLGQMTSLESMPKASRLLRHLMVKQDIRLQPRCCTSLNIMTEYRTQSSADDGYLSVIRFGEAVLHVSLKPPYPGRVSPRPSD